MGAVPTPVGKASRDSSPVVKGEPSVYNPSQPLDIRLDLRCWKEIHRDKDVVVYRLKREYRPKK